MFPFHLRLAQKERMLRNAPGGSDIVNGKIVKLHPYCQVDVPMMDYTAWLNASSDRLADLSGVPKSTRLVIIGGGMGGLVTGFELLRAGFTNFTIYESGTRLGGRFFSYQFPGDNVNYAELGAMRFPPTENCLYWYIKFLQDHGAKIIMNPDFPDPGLVPTLVMYKGKEYVIEPNKPVPEIFRDINESWNGFVTTTEPILLANGVTLDPPALIMQWLDVSLGTYNPIRAQNAWQAWVNYFKDKSFIQGVIEIFCQPNAPHRYDQYAKKFGARYQWKYPEDIEKFGTVGTGIGGQSPLFPESFICLMRFTLNKLEEQHALIVTGTDSVANSLADYKVGADTVRNHVKLNTRVGGVVPAADGRTISIVDHNKKIIEENIQYLVIATSNRAAEIELGIDSLWHLNNSSANGMLSQDKREALTSIHMAQSSKFFLQVKPWWLGAGNENRVRCITTDTAMANFYTLDYSETDQTAVCLMNYVWEDLSEKAEALGNLNERYQRFLHDLRQIPNIDYIVAAMPNEVTEKNAVMIDWQLQKFYNGAFVLTQATQEDYLGRLYYNFLTEQNPGAKIYFAGDSYSWVGGWVEGALSTGINAFAAMVKDMNGTFTAPNFTPLMHMNGKSIRYDNNSDTGNAMACGPFGGCSTGVLSFTEDVSKASSFTVYYSTSNQPIIRGLQINGQTYGTISGCASATVDLKQGFRKISVVACNAVDKNGRVRCFKINDTVYGGAPQSGDMEYVLPLAEDSFIVTVKGLYGSDIDRIGFDVQIKPKA